MVSRLGQRLVRKQIMRGDQHGRRAIAALQRVAVAEGGLQIVDRAAIGQPFDGLDRSPVGLHGERQTAPHDLAVDANRAGAANAMLAADMRAGQSELVAQKIRQMRAWLDLRFARSRH